MKKFKSSNMMRIITWLIMILGGSLFSVWMDYKLFRVLITNPYFTF